MILCFLSFFSLGIIILSGHFWCQPLLQHNSEGHLLNVCFILKNIQAFFKLKSFPKISEFYRLSYVHCSNFLQALLKNRNVAFRLRPSLPPPVESSFSCVEKVQPHHQNAMWFVRCLQDTLFLQIRLFKLYYLAKSCWIQCCKFKRLELLYKLLLFLGPSITGTRSLELIVPAPHF